MELTILYVAIHLAVGAGKTTQAVYLQLLVPELARLAQVALQVQAQALVAVLAEVILIVVTLLQVTGVGKTTKVVSLKGRQLQHKIVVAVPAQAQAAAQAAQVEVAQAH